MVCSTPFPQSSFRSFHMVAINLQLNTLLTNIGQNLFSIHLKRKIKNQLNSFWIYHLQKETYVSSLLIHVIVPCITAVISLVA